MLAVIFTGSSAGYSLIYFLKVAVLEWKRLGSRPGEKRSG